MKHLGDITKISGYTAPIVDCIIGGSPCQDLSVAGKRAGLDGERSGLYIEQVRIVKEMRERDEHNGRTGVDIRPRYMVWENVPGAFSSNKGDDFRIVLEELAKVKDKDAVIPLPDSGKWTNYGCIMGDGWSIAWRVLDAQFWGVPQRRRRIALVADFGGQSASEILFIRKSLSGDIDESKPQRQEAPSDATGGIGADDCVGVDVFNGNLTQDKVISLVATGNNSTGYSPKVMTPVTLKIRSGCEGGGKGALVQEDLSATLATNNDQYLFQPVYSIDQGGGKSSVDVREDQSPTLTTTHHGAPAVCYGVTTKGNGDCFVAEERHTALTVGGGQAGQGYPCVLTVHAFPEVNYNQFRASNTELATLKARGGTCGDGSETLVVAESGNNMGRTRYIVRRLTPLECERLQGYPDGWTDIGEWEDSNGKKRQTSDAARYKALGNSIALPPWKWVLKRLCACYERDATMASLFDGIGGFPYLWEQLNGKGTCLWASEIEEFPIAVTKVRIGV